MLVSAELVVAHALGSLSISDRLAARDPVSGSVYLAALLVFAVAPAPGKDRKA